ncbi:MAG TPA: C4-type zinc ribbon domain-containing protein [Candidatus Eisenbacteria bacterium]|nr:C4-type zinc ribbon domain-containing protein [Candidatus Eisenbacteria bacterium]
MNDEIRTLWALNGLDERLVALQAALARFPKDRATAEQRITGDRGRLEAIKKELGEFQVRRRAIEKDIEVLAAEERKFQGQLPLVKKNEEYTALLHEIAGAKQKRSDRETDLLVLMDEEERRSGEKPVLEKALAAAEAEAATRLKSLAAEEEQERAKVTAIEAERATLVVQLAANTRTRYERIRTGKGGRAVAPILKGACGGCYRGQAPQVLQEARRGDRVLICDGCGRMLIWPPESGG